MNGILPMADIDPSLLQLAKSVRIAIFDVDGVLTDGGIYFTESGEAVKRFNVLDGYGLQLLRKAGIEPTVVSGRDSPALRARLQSLDVRHARFGAMDKVASASEILATLGLHWSEAAAIGDDWPDLPLLRKVAFATAPPNAHSEVTAVVHYVTRRRGGEGAAREFCDLLLRASGQYARLLRASDGVPNA